MGLNKLTTIAFLTLCGTIAACVIAKAQTGNTGGSSGGTGSGQSGTGSGPAAWSPSTGGATFTGNPDANPYAKKDAKESFFIETTSTSAETTAPARKPRKRTTKTSKSSSSVKSKKKSSASPTPSASPSATAH
jgi:hypothetical protein